MAYFKAQATGNWSSTSTWAGTTVPYTTGGDYVYAAGFTVTIDTDVNVSLLTNLSATQGAFTFVGGSLSAATGGQFNISSVTGTRSVTATQILAGTSQTCLQISNPTGNITISAAGGIQASSTSSNIGGISINNTTGTITIYGDLSAGQGSATGCYGLDLTTPGAGTTINHYGGLITGPSNNPLRNQGNAGTILNIYGPIGVQKNNQGFFSNSGTGTVNITGNIICQNFGTSSLLGNSNTGTVTIVGDVSASQSLASAPAVSNSAAGTLNVIGNVYGGATQSYGITNTSTGTVNVSGTSSPGNLGGHGVFNNTAGGTAYITRIKGSNYGPATTGITQGFGAANNAQSCIVRFSELEYGPLGSCPHNQTGTYQLVNLISNKAIFYTSAAGTKTLVDAASAADFPAVSNVRLGTKFNNNNLTGTLAVPPASAVSQGVAIDNTIGTAALTPDSVWNYALSATTLNTLGDKVSKSATKSDLIALS